MKVSHTDHVSSRTTLRLYKPTPPNRHSLVSKLTVSLWSFYDASLKLLRLQTKITYRLSCSQWCLVSYMSGADPGFSWGRGGGVKGYVHGHTSGAKPEVQGPLNGPGSSRVFDAFSCYLSLFLIKHSDTKWDTKNMIVDRNLGGGGRLLRPSKSATCYVQFRSFAEHCVRAKPTFTQN